MNWKIPGPKGGVSILFFSYNHSRFLQEALDSITNQSMRPEELVLCDDGSIDDSQEILASFARKHSDLYRIHLLLRKENSGLARMLNDAMAAATSELCVIMSGDDVSRSTRVERLWASYSNHSRPIMMWSSNAEILDFAGRSVGMYHDRGFRPVSTAEGFAACMNGVLGATEAVHREVWRVFGAIPEGVYQEDVLLPFRAALLGSVEYLDEALVGYRFHDSNIHFGGVRAGAKHSAAELHRRQKRLIGNQVVIAQSRLRDLEVVRREGRIADGQLARLEKICNSTLCSVRWEQEIAAGSVMRSGFNVLRALWAGVPLKRCVRFLVMRWWPVLYSRVMLMWWRSRPRD
jgi:glycosyltransferase involved in cell wall biosynthesis